MPDAVRLDGYWCLLFALSSSAAELCAGVPKCQQEEENQPRKELRVRAGGSSESPDTNLSGYSLRGLNVQPYCLMLLELAPSASSQASQRRPLGPLLLHYDTGYLSRFLVMVDTDHENLRGSFLQIFTPGTYLIPMHISHVFEFWNPNSVLLWRLPHNENPQVSTFREKERKISYPVK